MKRHLLKAVALIRPAGGGRKPDDFTGKLVKSLLIDGSPRLKRFFEKEAGGAPKLIRVTPLYIESKKTLCVRSVSSLVEGRYAFYVGLVETEAADSPSLDEVYNALLDISGHHRYKNTTLQVELASLESIEVEKTARSVVSGLLEFGKMKVIFSSPTLLKDPLRRGKHKSLTPTPINIFSTPVYVNLYLSGNLRQKPYMNTLIALHRLLNEPYSVSRTARITWVRYDETKKPIPALAGYVNLYLNREYYEHYKSKGIDAKTLLEETISTTLTLGTGTSRATGFGHTLITTPRIHPAPDRTPRLFRNTP